MSYLVAPTENRKNFPDGRVLLGCNRHFLWENHITLFVHVCFVLLCWSGHFNENVIILKWWKHVVWASLHALVHLLQFHLSFHTHTHTHTTHTEQWNLMFILLLISVMKMDNSGMHTSIYITQVQTCILLLPSYHLLFLYEVYIMINTKSLQVHSQKVGARWHWHTTPFIQ